MGNVGINAESDDINGGSAGINAGKELSFIYITIPIVHEMISL